MDKDQIIENIEASIKRYANSAHYKVLELDTMIIEKNYYADVLFKTEHNYIFVSYVFYPEFNRLDAMTIDTSHALIREIEPLRMIEVLSYEA